MFLAILQITKHLPHVYFAPLPCAREADDADDEIQQNVV